MGLKIFLIYLGYKSKTLLHFSDEEIYVSAAQRAVQEKYGKPCSKAAKIPRQWAEEQYDSASAH